MKLKETYNIHKKINCLFPRFKSKFLCKKNIHNFQLQTKTVLSEPIIEEDGYNKRLTVPREYLTYWKCYCCGKTEKWEE